MCVWITKRITDGGDGENIAEQRSRRYKYPPPPPQPLTRRWRQRVKISRRPGRRSRRCGGVYSKHFRYFVRRRDGKSATERETKNNNNNNTKRRSIVYAEFTYCNIPTILLLLYYNGSFTAAATTSFNILILGCRVATSSQPSATTKKKKPPVSIENHPAAIFNVILPLKGNAL